MTTTIELPPETEPWQVHHKGPIPPHSVRHWVAQCVALCLPDRVYWCGGSPQERKMLLAEAARQDRPGHRAPRYVWVGPSDERAPDHQARDSACAQVRELFRGSMLGRTMYVIPFALDPMASGPDNVGVQLTDSADLVLGITAKTRTGDSLWRQLGHSESFTRRLHSMGSGNPGQSYVCQFTRQNTVWCLGCES